MRHTSAGTGGTTVVRERSTPIAQRLAGLLIIVACFGPGAGVGAELPPLPESGSDVHLGVVTCAGSTCHGATEPLKDSNVLQNEFITWHRQDHHARAYKVLLEKEGQRIGRNLRIKPESAAECLACHADFAAEAKRAKRHQMSDGVGCEACHGGGERYLGPHVVGALDGSPLETLHARNVSLGMYPTDEPVARATLCLSCHLGTSSKLATHRIMGAGHPRISFELDTFTALQPAHFRIDDDYSKRKAVYSGMQVWVVGQVIASRSFIDLFLDSKWKGTGVFPELAFFDCHACHHSMKSPRWNARETVQLPPGVPRLNDSNMLMLLHLARTLDPALGSRLHDGLIALHKSTLSSMDAARSAATSLKGVLAEIEQKALARKFSAQDMRAVLASLLNDGTRGEYNDYAGAEQSVMAMASIVTALRAAQDLTAAQSQQLDGSLKQLYDILKDEDTYQPERLVASMKTMQAQLQ